MGGQRWNLFEEAGEIQIESIPSKFSIHDFPSLSMDGFANFDTGNIEKIHKKHFEKSILWKLWPQF